MALGFVSKLFQTKLPIKDYPMVDARMHAKVTNDERWWEIWMDSYTVPCIAAALHSGVFEALAKKPCSVEDLCRARNLSPRTANVFLNHLEEVGMLKKRGNTFSLTALGETLTKKNGNREWRKWFFDYAKAPLTPAQYIEALTKDKPELLTPPIPDCESKIGLELLDILQTVYIFPALLTAHQIGLFEALCEAKHSEESLGRHLAKSLKQVSQPALAVLLNRLEDYSVLSYTERSVKLTKWAKHFLDPQSPFYKGGTLDLMKDGFASPAQSIAATEKEQRGGRTKMDAATIDSVALAKVFAKHMDAQGAGADVKIARSKVFKKADRILDVAGGGGSYSLMGAGATQADFLIMEKGAMTQIASEWIAANRGCLKGKVRVFDGDMFNKRSWTQAKKAIDPNKVFMSNIFHDWDEARNRMLAQHAFETLDKGGQIVLHEMLLDAKKGPYVATAFSETLRVWTQGRQYRLNEIKDILRSVGFKNIRSQKTLGYFSLIIADKK